MSWSAVMADDKQTRIIEARMKLRDRFLARIEGSPAMSDDAPLGTGPANRHGMPQLPPDQYETRKWPVLDLGVKPQIPTHAWQLQIDGACRAPMCLDWADFMAMPQVTDTSDFHCVTKWSRMDVPWVGVRFSELIAAAEPDDDAEFVMCHGFDGYTTNVPLAEALKPDVLLVHTADGAPLELEHGGPCRMITPQLYAWKGTKWIKRIELMTADRLGFWEERGYSNSAHPWRNDRYS
jgi:DMSO/TMAO reductase YedYZ molybdopterin-dependent catalytic subunit